MNESLWPNGQRANVAKKVLWLLLVLETAYLIFIGTLFFTGNGLIGGQNSKNALLSIYENYHSYLWLIFGLAYLVGAVYFISWFRRAYYNLHLLRNDLRYSEDWALTAWLIPLLNLVEPIRIMSELFSKGQQELAQKKEDYTP